MAATITITSVTANQNTFIVEGTIALTGNYGGASTHGDTLSFAGFDQIKASTPPRWCEIDEFPAAGTAPSFYQFVFCPGTTQANGVISIGSNLTEYTQASAYSAALLAAAIQFRAEFVSFV